MTWVSIFQNPTTISVAQGLAAEKEKDFFFILFFTGIGIQSMQKHPWDCLQGSTE